MEKVIHTPEGVRDIYNIECGKKLALEGRLGKTLHLYGYHDIQTPTFEYFDVFGKDIGTISSRELYKFFDRDGDTVSLRPDITPSIARAAATLFASEELPIRLCYKGNTFVNYSSYQGRLREVTQLGAELVGDASVDADAEMLAMVADALLGIGLKDFQISVGNMAFFSSLIEEAGLREDEETRVIELVNNHNFFALEEFLDKKRVSRSTKEAFTMLGELNGGSEVLSKARNIALNSEGVMAVKRLEKLYMLLKSYDVEKYISFDLSMTGTYGYYTGIVFRAYTYGTGDAIVKGGRYDHLLEKFGKKSPSIGFAIVIDELMNALIRQKVRIVYTRRNTIILYDDGKMKAALSLARDFRNKAKNTELFKKAKNKSFEDYVRFGKEYYAGSLIYLKKNGEVIMVNLVTGETKSVQSKEDNTNS